MKHFTRQRITAALVLVLCGPTVHAAETQVVLLEDGFGELRTGSLGSDVSAHAEYHYVPEVGPKGNWWITSFVSGSQSQRAWRVARHNNQPVLLQTYDSTKLRHTHPMVVAGEELWADYTVTVRFVPESAKGRSGVIFRYHNDRCYYFFGIEGTGAVLKMVRHESDFHIPFEKTLASQEFSWKPGEELTAVIAVAGNHIEAKLNGTLVLKADDSTFPQGRIALTANVPTQFTSVRVTASPTEQARVAAARAKIEAESRELQAANP